MMTLSNPSRVEQVSESIDGLPVGTATKVGGRVHLRYLDSLRGLAAVYVVFHHAYVFGITNRIWQYPRLLRPIYSLMLYGHFAVALFIVLSGYCLTIPVAKSNDKRLPDGFFDYLRRRAWRILPAYYATVVLSVVLTAVALKEGSIDIRAWTTAGLVAHLFMVHNLSGFWCFQLNPALWSVTTEWQIYFFFPFFLIPIWRRLGIGTAVAASFILTSGPYFVFRNHPLLTQAGPWYLTLFATGMAAAYINFSQDLAATRLRNLIPWRRLPLLLIVSAVTLARIFAGSKERWIEEPIFGIIVAGFLAYLHWCMTEGPVLGLPLALRALNGDVLFNTGQFSYSIYLLNMPLLALFRALMLRHPLSHTVHFLIVIPVEAILCIGASYLLYLGFERPFLKRRYKKPIPPNTASIAATPA